LASAKRRWRRWRRPAMARAAFDRLQAATAKAGWTKKESKGGYGVRPDVSTLATLPKASK
jgi:hypothetical protein